MVSKLCSRSQGQPEPGVRSAAMISIRRAMSREGFTPRPPAAPVSDSHKTYYGISLADVSLGTPQARHLKDRGYPPEKSCLFQMVIDRSWARFCSSNQNLL